MTFLGWSSKLESLDTYSALAANQQGGYNQRFHFIDEATEAQRE